MPILGFFAILAPPLPRIVNNIIIASLWAKIGGLNALGISNMHCISFKPAQTMVIEILSMPNTLYT